MAIAPLTRVFCKAARGFRWAQWSLAIARARRGQSIDPAGRAKGRDAFRRGPSRPVRNRTCNPRFWSALPATPALKPLLIFNDLGPGQQRRRRWTTPALTLFLALRRTRRAETDRGTASEATAAPSSRLAGR